MGGSFSVLPGIADAEEDALPKPPLPLRERIKERGRAKLAHDLAFCFCSTPHSGATPLPNPLPQGERGLVRNSPMVGVK
jgi:hypothetical protein